MSQIASRDAVSLPPNTFKTHENLIRPRLDGRAEPGNPARQAEPPRLRQDLRGEEERRRSRDEREALRQALTFIREGDQLVITRLDRLARSVLDLSQITAEIAAKKVDLVVLDQSIDTGSPTGRLLFHMLAAIGEFERDLIKERAAEGIARAKAAGVKFGAKSKLSAEQIAALKAEFAIPTTNRKELARRYGISRATVYRICAVADGRRCRLITTRDDSRRPVRPVTFDPRFLPRHATKRPGS